MSVVAFAACAGAQDDEKKSVKEEIELSVAAQLLESASNKMNEAEQLSANGSVKLGAQNVIEIASFEYKQEATQAQEPNVYIGLDVKKSAIMPNVNIPAMSFAATYDGSFLYAMAGDNRIKVNVGTVSSTVIEMLIQFPIFFNQNATYLSSVSDIAVPDFDLSTIVGKVTKTTANNVVTLDFTLKKEAIESQFGFPIEIPLPTEDEQAGAVPTVKLGVGKDVKASVVLSSDGYIASAALSGQVAIDLGVEGMAAINMDFAVSTSIVVNAATIHISAPSGEYIDRTEQTVGLVALAIAASNTAEESAFQVKANVALAALGTLSADFKLARTTNDVKVSGSTVTGGLLGMMLKSTDYYYPADGSGNLYMSSDGVKTVQNAGEYLESMQEMASLAQLLPTMLGVDVSTSANTADYIKASKNMSFEKKRDGRKVITLEFDLLKIFPNNLNENGSSKFTAQSVQITIGSNNLLKALDVKLQITSGENVSDIKVGVQLAAVGSSVKVKAPEGFEHIDYTNLKDINVFFGIGGLAMATYDEAQHAYVAHVGENAAEVAINAFAAIDKYTAAVNAVKNENGKFQLNGKQTEFEIIVTSPLGNRVTCKLIIIADLYELKVTLTDTANGAIVPIYQSLYFRNGDQTVYLSATTSGVYTLYLDKAVSGVILSDSYELVGDTGFSVTKNTLNLTATVIS